MVTFTTPAQNNPLSAKLITTLLDAEKPYLRVVEERQGFSEIEAFMEKAPPFEKIVVLGMGGSILGTRALATFAGVEDRLLFMDNLDSGLFRRGAEVVRDEEVLLIPISKSGGTLETLAMLGHLYPVLEGKYGEKASSRVAAVTASPQGKLGAWAAARDIVQIPMPEDLSGRFSVFSSVGSLPLTLAGYDMDSLYAGALQAVSDLRTPEGERNFLDLLSVLLSGKDTPLVLFTYGAHISPIAAWFCQLWAESLGKDAKFGKFPSFARGTADQHSVLQMILDVPDSTTTWVWYAPEDRSPDIGNEQLGLPSLTVSDYLRAAAKGLYSSLEKQQVHRAWLEFEDNEISRIGHLLMTLMLITHAASFELGVSTFDQPAVELAKKFTKENVAGMAKKG